MSDPVLDLKRELLAAADRRHSVPAGRRRTHVLLAAATLAIAAAVALVFAAPWSSSPAFLERAQAALTAPAGTILHEKWQVTVTSTDPACTVTHKPNEIWIDETPPHRYRVLINDIPEPGRFDPQLICESGRGSELGGTFGGSEQTLEFVPPNTLTAPDIKLVLPVDPVADLREWLRAGTAHDEGKVELDGQTVERIRIDPPTDDCHPFPDCPDEPMYWYADPETLDPVETRGPGFFGVAGQPLIRLRLVMRYLTFEYLPRTKANLALADIRAQHPTATGP
jgi:hypothetical protein